MRRLMGVVLAAASITALGACSEMAKHTNDGVQGIQQASGLRCNNERAQIQSAIDNYEILKGSLPTSMADLVPDYLRAASTLYDIDPTGHIVAVPGSGCS